MLQDDLARAFQSRLPKVPPSTVADMAEDAQAIMISYLRFKYAHLFSSESLPKQDSERQRLRKAAALPYNPTLSPADDLLLREMGVAFEPSMPYHYDYDQKTTGPTKA